ncbi:MAG: plasmid replication protein, CyRepA1 family, partial [Chroococcales cyanobacterium]
KALLDKEGIDLQFADWGQWDDKSQPDCDELPEGTAIAFRSAIDFFGPDDANPETIREHREFTDEEKAQWRLKKDWERWEKGYAFSNARQLKGEWFNPPIPNEGVLFAGKAPLGAGKTTWMVKFFEANKDQSIHDWGIRNTLKLQTAEKTGAKHLREHDGFSLLKEPGAKLTYCIHSLPNIPHKDLEGKWIILDEATSIVRSLLFDSLLMKKGNAVYAEIVDKFIHALATCKGIIALDGFMTDWCINLLAAFAPHLEIQKCELKKVVKEHINWHQGCFDSEGKINSKDFSSLLAVLQDALESGENVAIAADSQRQAEALDVLGTNLGFETERIDSKTTPNPETKKLLAKPNEYIRANKPRLLIYTGACESGFDVDILDYFHLQICLFAGVIEADKLCQMIYRIRHVKERHVWCSPHGIGNDSFEGVNANHLKRNILNHCLQDFMDAGFDGRSLTVTFDRPQDLCALQVLDRANHEHRYLAESLKRLLILRGVTITESAAESIPHLKAENSEIKNQIKVTEAKQIFDAIDLTDREADSISSNIGANWQDRCAAMKHSLKRQLKGIENDPVWSWEFIHFVRSQERGIITQCKRWIMLANDAIALPLHRHQWQQAMDYGVNLWGWRSDRAIVLAIKELGLLELPDTFTAISPEVATLIEKWNSSPAIKARLKRSSGKDPIKAIGWLCQKIGLRVGAKKTVNGTRFYSISFNKHKTPEWGAIEKRLKQAMQTKAQELAESTKSPSCAADSSQDLGKPYAEGDLRISKQGADQTMIYKESPDLHPDLEPYFYNLSALADDPNQGDAETLAVLTEGLTEGDKRQIWKCLSPLHRQSLKTIAKTFTQTPERVALIRESTALFKVSGLTQDEFKALIGTFKVAGKPCPRRDNLSTPMLQALVRILKEKTAIALTPMKTYQTENNYGAS